MAKISYMTQESYDKLMAELDVMKTTGRKEIANAIAEARSQGDLSENAEYDAAKDAQGMHEMKINELETALASAKVISMDDIDTSQASVLTTVKIRNVANKAEMSYKLVSQSEANLKEKKISVSSPIGEGLLGKKVGDIAEIKTPRGIMKFEVLDISLT